MEIYSNIPLAPKTTFRIGGTADFFVEADSSADLQEACLYAKDHSLPVMILGGGSNMLISDSGFRGMVIHPTFAGVTYEKEGNTVLCIAGAGEDWDGLVLASVERGLSGIENLSGIPGSVGATPVQNVGAYGVEVGDVIAWVEVYNVETDHVYQLSTDECRFQYRTSIFKSNPELIITRVAYRLHTVPLLRTQYADIERALREEGLVTPNIADIRRIVLSIRAQKFPDLSKYGTAGSFFKNPIITQAEYERLAELFPGLPRYVVADDVHVKIPIAFIIERLHLRGIRQGDVGIYENHALVIVNYGSASCDEVDTFASMITEKIFDATHIHIAREVITTK